MTEEEFALAMLKLGTEIDAMIRDCEELTARLDALLGRTETKEVAA